MAKLGNQPSSPSINGLAFKSSPSPVSRLGLSGDSDTSPLSITTAGVLVHQATNYTYDEVFLWVSNYTTSDRFLTLEIGGDGSFSDPSKTVKIDVDKEVGLMQVYPGIPHRGVSVYAKADLNSALNIFGYVDRHSQISLSDESLGYHINPE
tara:strand:+ start:1584 stop:2036 length:453 start_codon:yes stop_codon:yes gene_type:complete